MTERRDLDDLLADIAELEAEADDELRPLPGETREEFQARMLAELDEMLADERRNGVRDDQPWFDSARWKPPVPAFDPLQAPYLVQDGEELMIRGDLSVSIGGRRLGKVPAKTGHWDRAAAQDRCTPIRAC